MIAATHRACMYLWQVLEYRRLFPLLSNFVSNLQTYRHHSLNGDVLHAVVDYRTATGRLKVSSPSLQGLPRECPLDAFADPDSESNQRISIRRTIIPRPGHCFVSADYSQVLLQSLATVSSMHACASCCLLCHHTD